MMKALVVYESVYGNTERIARAIADALGPSGDVTLVRAGEARPSHLAGIDLLVVGTPTQGGRPRPSIDAFLKEIPAHALENVAVASFDTRIEGLFARIFGYPASRIADTQKARGGRLVGEPAGFIVKGREGPLKEGELERVAAWARQLVASLA
jgi:flavodoxin I